MVGVQERYVDKYIHLQLGSVGRARASGATLLLKSHRGCIARTCTWYSQLIVQHNGKVVWSCSLPPVFSQG